jgi:hypothetical protein
MSRHQAEPHQPVVGQEGLARIYKACGLPGLSPASQGQAATCDRCHCTSVWIKLHPSADSRSELMVRLTAIRPLAQLILLVRDR